MQELKFLLPRSSAAGVQAWVRTRLQPDPHGGGDERDRYRVSSVYFDTAALDVLARRASYARSKYRVRRYDEAAMAFLERKTKGARRVYKRRIACALDQLPRLQQRELDAAWGGYWFHRRLQWRSLQAVCRIDYERMARIGMSDYGPIRVTLDQDLRVWPARAISFDTAGEPIWLPQQPLILELKFGAALPALFKQLIAEFALQPQGISKYRLACERLGLRVETAAAAIAEAQPEKLSA